ncbi:MAG: hypothetical protein WC505_04900 [Patescibacteria group bacterium]
MKSFPEQQRELFDKLEQGSVRATSIAMIRDYTRETRMCLTGIAFVPQSMRPEISARVIEPLRERDARQHYYPPESLHVTIQNVRRSSDPPRFTPDTVARAREVFRSVVPRHRRFSFELRGLFEMPASLSVRAYSDEALGDLVFDLRDSLRAAGIPDDKQYAPGGAVFGNCTVCRFTRKPNAGFAAVVRELKQAPVGTFEVADVSLKTTNAVCDSSVTAVIGRFPLQ